MMGTETPLCQHHFVAQGQYVCIQKHILQPTIPKLIDYNLAYNLASAGNYIAKLFSSSLIHVLTVAC